MPFLRLHGRHVQGTGLLADLLARLRSGFVEATGGVYQEECGRRADLIVGGCEIPWCPEMHPAGPARWRVSTCASHERRGRCHLARARQSAVRAVSETVAPSSHSRLREIIPPTVR